MRFLVSYILWLHWSLYSLQEDGHCCKELLILTCAIWCQSLGPQLENLSRTDREFHTEVLMLWMTVSLISWSGQVLIPPLHGTLIGFKGSGCDYHHQEQQHALQLSMLWHSYYIIATPVNLLIYYMQDWLCWRQIHFAYNTTIAQSLHNNTLNYSCICAHSMHTVIYYEHKCLSYI